MTRDDIIGMAKNKYGIYAFTAEGLERFAAIVAAPLEEEIKRLRFCTTEGDAAAAMEYLAYCVEKEVTKEQERCMEIVERELEAALGYVAVPLGNKITAAIRARGI
jgi:CMP-2-keto-3-deoxyoctulosonic acid synthetase